MEPIKAKVIFLARNCMCHEMLRMLYVHITFYFYSFSVLFLDFFPKQKSFVNPGFLIADIYLLFTFHSVWFFFM